MPQTLFNNGHISQKNYDIKIIDRILFDNVIMIHSLSYLILDKHRLKVFAINTNLLILTLNQLLNCIKCGPENENYDLRPILRTD